MVVGIIAIVFAVVDVIGSFTSDEGSIVAAIISLILPVLYLYAQQNVWNDKKGTGFR